MVVPLSVHHDVLASELRIVRRDDADGDHGGSIRTGQEAASVRSSRAVHALVGAGLVGVCEGLRFG